MGRIRAVTSHVLLAVAEGSLIAAVVVALIAGTVFAAKGGNGGNSGGRHLGADRRAGVAQSQSNATPASPTPAPVATSAPVSTPTATPAPTAAATRTPIPTSTPAPTVSPSGIAVPSSIDSTGATDVSAALLSFIASVPDGSTIVFKAGGIYRVDLALKINGRSNLIFEGNGATLRAGGTGNNENYSLFYFQSFNGGNHFITVRNFLLLGNSPTPGVFLAGQEGQHGVLVDGGSDFDISGNTSGAMYGDFVEVNSAATRVRVHGNTVTNTGRNGVSIIWGNHVEIDHNTFTSAGYVTFDIEPNVVTESCTYISFHDNIVRTWGQEFFALDGSHTGALITNIAVDGNTATSRSLKTVVDNGGTTRNTAISFTNNTSIVAVAGPVLTFAHVDGLTVTGNLQSLTLGPLASITDSTSVIYP